MSKSILAIVVFSILGLGIIAFFLMSGDSTTNNNSTSNINQQQSNNSQQITDDVNAGKAKLYDVRTPEEYKAGHVKIAENFDSVLIAQGQYPQVDKNSTVYIYCRSGNRATDAKKQLEQNGFKNVVNLGGLNDITGMGFTISS